MRIRSTILPAAAVAALLAPAAAQAASKPDVRTGGVANVTPSTVQLNGRVDANGAATTYFFQIGTTKLYGRNTAPGTVTGNSLTGVSAAVDALAPATRYHYRLVASNRIGLTKGPDRTFKTKVQPLGVTLAASPQFVAPGAATTLVGQLTGTNRGNRQVVLQAAAFPYMTGFATTGNPQVTDADGHFAFPVLSVPVTTQFRVLMPSKPEVVSLSVVVGAALRVKTHKKKVARFRHSVRVRFKGRVAPASPGRRVSIQKNRDGVWTEIAHTRLGGRSRYNVRVRIGKSGQFRVVAQRNDQYVSGAGRTVTVHAPH
jgi:hypothetical protein